MTSFGNVNNKIPRKEYGEADKIQIFHILSYIYLLHLIILYI